MSAFSNRRCPECGSLSTGLPESPPSMGETFDPSVEPETRHYALLTSNEPPEESESTFIQSLISKTDAPLARLDKEISKLQEHLKMLEEAREFLRGYRTWNKAIFSPLRRIPPEVLREIFSWTLPSIRDALHSGRFEMGQSPWVLTQVCSRWRAVSISTPSLWSQVAIDYPQNLRTSSTYSLSLVEAQIQRSQKLKIHFYGNHKMDSRVQIQMFELLSQHSSHWEELSIGLTSAIAPLLTSLRDRIPSLARLWIQWDGWQGQIGIPSIDCFETAPSLVDVGVLNKHRFLPILLPAYQLTRYEVDCPWEEHRRILTQTLGLIEARVYVDFDEEPWPDPNEIIGLLQLQRLYVSDPQILRYLMAPALKGLALLGAPEDGSELLSHFHSFLDRSSCRLQRLCFRGHPTPSTTTEILQKCPSITELVLVHDDDNARESINALIASLTVSNLPKSTVVAPHLELVYVGCPEESYIDYAAFLEMLESRWKAENCALKTAALVIEDGPGPDPRTCAGLLGLHAEGLNLLLLDGVAAQDEMECWSFSASWN
ncbi:F-box domain-containing protein [Mycena venus]|uniref:F-box domain-containing protein n=1 Tax=Mycena venus TaxID=2733690 RepID=A0A8H6YCN4_9AGAR|nr:F-box domain-containing protein [Mycena venus]